MEPTPYLASSPADIDILTAEAEQCMAQGDNREAIRRWIGIAGLLGDKTPENIYHRLGAAYERINGSFGGLPEENRIWGDWPKHRILGLLHEGLDPDLYLEIGVDQGVSLALARGRAIGVDARPSLRLTAPIGDQTTLISLSSDAFFRERAADLLRCPPALVFIDGMHLFEFALRDFMNVERHASPATLVVMDDIYPCHPAQAARLPRTDTWAGDVWKLVPILRKWRPDLILLTLNAIGTGLLLIVGLDPQSQVLGRNYQRIVKGHCGDMDPPLEILTRVGTLASDNPILPLMLDVLKQAFREGWPSARVREAVQALSNSAS
jgi:hypothetical protein